MILHSPHHSIGRSVSLGSHPCVPWSVSLGSHSCSLMSKTLKIKL
jgi:hypothetical protein